MARQTEAEDDSTEPEYTDAEVRDAACALQNLVDDDYELSLTCSNVYAQQVDNPLTEDYDGLTLYMTGEPGSGATKATIIQKVLASDVPVTLKNTCEGYGHIEFKVDY